MATPKTGNPRGRPKGATKSFRTDRDMLAVALAWWLMAGSMSENSAYKLAGEVASSKAKNSADPLGATVTRLRKKGARWFNDPLARDQITKIAIAIAKASIEFEKAGGFDDLDIEARIKAKITSPTSH